MVDKLSKNIDNHIYSEFIERQKRPFSVESLIQLCHHGIKSCVIHYDSLVPPPEVDLEEQNDEPEVPIKDRWCTDYVNVEKVQKLYFDPSETIDEADAKSVRSYRSFARSHASVFTKTKRTFMKVKSKQSSKIVKLKITQKEIPEDEIRLRERKEKQILHRKKEAAEKKRLKEEERQDKMKKRFALGGDPKASLTCDHNGKPIVVKKLNVNKLRKAEGPGYSFEAVNRDQIKAMKRKQQKKFEIYSKELFPASINSKSIVDDLNLSAEDFIDESQCSATFGDLSSVLALMPGVQYNTRDKTLRGPLYRRENKMAIHDYKVISNSRENAKIRYDIHEGSPVVKPKEEKTPISEVKHDSIANMGSVIKKKGHGYERMKGDATKSGILQEDHHLHNISSKHFGSGSLSQSRRINEGAFRGRKNNDYFTREQGMRPTTA
ncbi:unnamed protein product [Moneuplotes crassus]|uniref:Uncharacterized protein n=1 Tax=Euplotes crassus TaxID=5936 RepID=A0AAD1UA03_EUPCR|nr:unnamed protein product [Moneuplotes crassus]